MTVIRPGIEFLYYFINIPTVGIFLHTKYQGSLWKPFPWALLIHWYYDLCILITTSIWLSVIINHKFARLCVWEYGMATSSWSDEQGLLSRFEIGNLANSRIQVESNWRVNLRHILLELMIPSTNRTGSSVVERPRGSAGFNPQSGLSFLCLYTQEIWWDRIREERFMIGGRKSL